MSKVPKIRHESSGLRSSEPQHYSCNYFRSNPTYMTMHAQRYGRTDRQTDGLFTIAILRYAHSALRGKNTQKWAGQIHGRYTRA